MILFVKRTDLVQRNVVFFTDLFSRLKVKPLPVNNFNGALALSRVHLFHYVLSVCAGVNLLVHI